MAESTSPITFQADVAIAEKLRVAIKTASTTTPPEVDIAGATEHGVGVNQYVVAIGDDCAVVPFNKTGTVEMVAAGAFNAGVAIYPAAGGKVDDAVSGDKLGISMGVATADGDIVEILPQENAA